jgi:glycerol uptake facilitator-like aquaporin
MRPNAAAGTGSSDHEFPAHQVAARCTAHLEGRVIQRPHTRAWLSEFAGTTILLFAAVLVARWVFGPRSPLASAVPGTPGRLAIVGVVIGGVVGLLIISPFGRSSGGHFNPAVTLTLWLLRGLPGQDAAGYVAAQLAGSLAGVMLGRAVLGTVLADPAVNYAAIEPAVGWFSGAVFAGEAISLAVLMALVVAFLDRPAHLRWTPAAVAAGVAVLIFAGGFTSGGSFNPARQLGPLLFAGRLSYLWAYMLGPITGAVILVVLVKAVGLPQPLTCSLCGTPPRGAAPKQAMHPATTNALDGRRPAPEGERSGRGHDVRPGCDRRALGENVDASTSGGTSCGAGQGA